MLIYGCKLVVIPFYEELTNQHNNNNNIFNETKNNIQIINQTTTLTSSSTESYSSFIKSEPGTMDTDVKQQNQNYESNLYSSTKSKANTFLYFFQNINFFYKKLIVNNLRKVKKRKKKKFYLIFYY